MKVVDFGAFVNFFGAKDTASSASARSATSASPSRPDVLKEGQIVKVKLLGFDLPGDRGETASCR
ncbi:hypothetical protein ACRAWD_25720 [Caulobacter segnis]